MRRKKKSSLHPEETVSSVKALRVLPEEQTEEPFRIPETFFCFLKDVPNGTGLGDLPLKIYKDLSRVMFICAWDSAL